ncbi:MAG TPA: hypothetical protein IAC49_06480 [Candidatus Ventricola intestinavium]|nr:hypothetical protein [Candidatus Ventricola intestinavium]
MQMKKAQMHAGFMRHPMKITPGLLSEWMMNQVYVPFSMVVSLDGRAEVLTVCQVDTEMGELSIRLAPDAEEIWLLTNHPDGYTGLYEGDRKNLRRILRMAGPAKLIVFVAGEEIGCMQVWESE